MAGKRLLSTDVISSVVNVIMDTPMEMYIYFTASMKVPGAECNDDHNILTFHRASENEILDMMIERVVVPVLSVPYALPYDPRDTGMAG